MNNDKSIQTTEFKSSILDVDPDFISIDDPNIQWPDFVLAMLRVGRILTAKDPVVREVTAQRINRIMNRHRTQMPTVYLPKEIRENLWKYGGEIRGGGIQIEWSELTEKYCGSPVWYHFTFSRVYKSDGVKRERNLPETELMPATGFVEIEQREEICQH